MALRNLIGGDLSQRQLAEIYLKLGYILTEQELVEWGRTTPPLDGRDWFYDAERFAWFDSSILERH